MLKIRGYYYSVRWLDVAYIEVNLIRANIALHLRLD